MCYGCLEHILQRIIDKARRFLLSKDRLESMIDFALYVKNIHSIMEACNMEAHMNNPILENEVVEKLSSQYKLNWAVYPKSDKVPIVKLFRDWISQIADAASTIVSVVPTSRGSTMNTHKKQRPPFKSSCEHKVSECDGFKKVKLQRI